MITVYFSALLILAVLTLGAVEWILNPYGWLRRHLPCKPLEPRYIDDGKERDV